MKLETCPVPSELEEHPWRTVPPVAAGGNRAAQPTSDDGSRDTDSSATAGPCGLVQCRKSDCDLSSHRHFVAARRRASSTTKRRPSGDRSRATLWQLPLNELLDRSVLRIQRQIADGFPTVPFKHEASAMFRELINHYFANQIDRLIQLYSPHLDRRTYKTTMMEHALSNDVFCICLAANAKTDMLMRSHTRSSDRNSEMVYAATAHVLRQKLDNFKQTDLDWLLVLVVALVGFDLAFERVDNLRGHHQALKQLVALTGGIHAVGHIVPYVLNTDRFLAVFTGAHPLFKQSPILARLPQTDGGVSPYGGAFKRPAIAERIDKRVVGFCLELCQLVHLMEKYQISMDPSKPVALRPSVLPHFLYLRDRMGCEGTCLYAEYHENQNLEEPSIVVDGCDEQQQKYSRPLSKSRCVLLAAMIIEYHVLNANYYSVKGPFLATQLKSVLERQPAKEWNGNVDMLIWVLFVLAAVPEEWKHHDWAIQALKKRIPAKYHGRRSHSNRKDDTLSILREHLWSDSLGKLFERTCKQVIKTGK